MDICVCKGVAVAVGEGIKTGVFVNILDVLVGDGIVVAVGAPENVSVDDDNGITVGVSESVGEAGLGESNCSDVWVDESVGDVAAGEDEGGAIVVVTD